MLTVHQPPDTGPMPPPETTPYFLRCAVLAEAVADEVARRGLPPGPLAA